MNKKLIYILSFLLVLIASNYLYSQIKMQKVRSKLTGTVEVVFDSGIKEIYLPSGNTTDLLNKTSGYLVNDFALSPDGRTRIFAGPSNDNTQLVMLSDEKKCTPLFAKASIETPSFSPDGNRISYLFCPYSPKQNLNNNDCFLFEYNLITSTDTKTSNRRLIGFRPVWFSDGERLLVTELSRAIVEVGRPRLALS